MLNKDTEGFQYRFSILKKELLKPEIVDSILFFLSNVFRINVYKFVVSKKVYGGVRTRESS